MRRSIAKLTRAQQGEERELPISTIDIVFLLLIFFMCSMQFRSVERKLDSELPKTEGPHPRPMLTPQARRSSTA